MRRVRCVGFSRGARFCSRLASELSIFISAIAAVSGIRFPEPNNSTRPMPIIAFHGLKDSINPFWGIGPAYWGESVPLSVLKWARFNGCKSRQDVRFRTNVVVIKYSDCTDNAEVVLYKLMEGDHEWPDTNVICARELILEFFAKHVADTGCHTVTKHDTRYRHCYQHTNWARTEGISQHPGLYGNLTNESSFAEFQAMLHRKVYSNCPNPCGPAGEANLQHMPRYDNAEGETLDPIVVHGSGSKGGVDEHRGQADQAERVLGSLKNSERQAESQVKDSPRVGKQHVRDRRDDVRPAKPEAPRPAKQTSFWGQATARYLLGFGVLMVVVSAISFLMPQLKAASRGLIARGKEDRSPSEISTVPSACTVEVEPMLGPNRHR